VGAALAVLVVGGGAGFTVAFLATHKPSPIGHVVPLGSANPTPVASPTVSSPPLTGYLCESVNTGETGSWVIYLATASGTLYQAQADTTEVEAYPGTLQLVGSTLVLRDSLYSNTDAPNLLESGQYAVIENGDTLTIAVPWSDGTVHSYACFAAPLSAYNQDVSQMQATISAYESASAASAQASAAASAQAAQASAAASAQAAASAAAQAAAVIAKEEATCAQAGGSWGTVGYDLCQLRYQSPSDGQTYDYTVDFDANGNVTVAPCSDQGFSETHDCLDQPETAQQAQADCLNGSYNGGQPGEWHSDTDICSL